MERTSAGSDLEQGGCAVAFVIMRNGLAAALLQRQAGLGAVQSLNLTLLIYGKDQRMFWRIEIQTNNGLQFFGEMRIVADLEALDAVRLQSMRTPDAAHAGLGDAHLERHPAARPMRGSGRLGLRGSGNHPSRHLRRNRRCPSRSGLLTDPAGRPVAVRVFPGNTAYPTAFTTIVQAVKDTFKLTDMVMVGDRGMITSARVQEL